MEGTRRVHGGREHDTRTLRSLVNLIHQQAWTKYLRPWALLPLINLITLTSPDEVLAPMGTTAQGWKFGRFLVLLGFRRLYSLSGKHSPSIPFPIEPEIPGTQSTRLRPQFHTESLIGKPKILKRQTHGITTKAYRLV